jgi:hypothetical protein
LYENRRREISSGPSRPSNLAAGPRQHPALRTKFGSRNADFSLHIMDRQRTLNVLMTMTRPANWHRLRGHFKLSQITAVSMALWTGGCQASAANAPTGAAPGPTSIAPATVPESGAPVPVPAAPASIARPALQPDASFADRLAAWTTYTLQLPMPEYPLNDWTRTVPATGKLQCPDVAMVNYKGTTLKYGKSLRVYEGLVPHIEKMETIIVEVATHFYGRAPKRVRTLGTLNCRRMRTYPTYISEHAFANAIDIEGFEFAPATKAQRSKVDKALRGAQHITVLGDWNGGTGNKAVHQQFLQTLVLELIKQDVFTLYLGPVFPGHKNHFHFDMSNFRMVEI